MDELSKSRFFGDLDTRLVDEFDEIHQLLAPFTFYSAKHALLIVVPEGFLTDFASVPRLPLAYLTMGGRGKRAAVIHDWMYQCAPRWSRDLCDEVFAEALRASGYTAPVVWAMYQGVRVGGQSRYLEDPIEQEHDVAELMDLP
jgi:hypothetical protein